MGCAGSSRLSGERGVAEGPPTGSGVSSSWRPVLVVVGAPVFDEDLGFDQRIEVPQVQQFVTETAVERLDPGVLTWRPGVDEHGIDMVEPAPVRDRVGHKFWAVVETDERGRAAAFNTEPVEHGDDVVGVDVFRWRGLRE